MATRQRLAGAANFGGLLLLTFTLTLALAGPRAACGQELAGLYTVAGAEPEKGAYSGTAELRWNGHAYDFLRTVTYAGYTFEGFSVATAWQGTAAAGPAGLAVSVPLARMGWIAQVGPLVRTPGDTAPVTVSGSFAGSSGGPLTGSFGAPVGAAETWTYAGPPAPAPHFATSVLSVPMHGAPPASVKSVLFALYHGYHLLPAVAPSAARPDFNAAVHINVVDHTDFAFLRAHPGVIRVLGSVVDPISLTEAHVRSNAFRNTLAAKAALLDAAAPTFVNPPGMIADTRHPATGELIGIGSSALWTGAYIASQSFRYQVTHEAAALANVQHSLEGLLACVDAPGMPGVFARAVRPATGVPGDGWHPGTGAHAGLDWLERGNNDMSKGLLYGFLTAWDALPAGHPKRAAIRSRVLTLLAHSSIIRDGRLNEMMWNRLAACLTGEAAYAARYRRLMLNPAYLAWITAGNGAVFEQGTTDWSGNHLNLVHQVTINLLGARPPADPFSGVHKMSFRNAYLRLRKTRPGLFTLAYRALGGFTVKPEDASWVEDARWVLREYPAPNVSWRVDHTLRPDWSMSPYPSLPWKLDWLTNAGRQQSLYAYSMFQRPQAGYEWRASPLRFAGGGDERAYNGVDYLHAYWIARRYGVLGAEE